MAAEERSLRVLLVEDDPDMQARVLDVLPAPAFEVEAAATVAELRRRLGASEVDVVVLDLGLPDSHGLQTLLALRVEAPSVAVVILTSHDDPATAFEAVRRGAEDVLPKENVWIDVLPRIVQLAFARRRIRSASKAGGNGEELRQVLSRETDGAVVITPEGVVRFVNPAAEMLFARTAESFVGRELGAPVSTAAPMTLDLRCPDDTVRQVEARFEPVTWDDEPATIVWFRSGEREHELASALEVAEEIAREIEQGLADPLPPNDGRSVLAALRVKAAALASFLGAIQGRSRPGRDTASPPLRT